MILSRAMLLSIPLDIFLLTILISLNHKTTKVNKNLNLFTLIFLSLSTSKNTSLDLFHSCLRLVAFLSHYFSTLPLPQWPLND